MNPWKDAARYFAHWDDQEFLNGAFRISACLKCGALVGQGMQELHLDSHEQDTMLLEEVPE
jgi:hypothetical protein